MGKSRENRNDMKQCLAKGPTDLQNGDKKIYDDKINPKKNGRNELHNKTNSHKYLCKDSEVMKDDFEILT